MFLLVFKLFQSSSGILIARFGFLTKFIFLGFKLFKCCLVTCISFSCQVIYCHLLLERHQPLGFCFGSTFGIGSGLIGSFLLFTRLFSSSQTLLLF
jgi:hypothetical protein